MGNGQFVKNEGLEDEELESDPCDEPTGKSTGTVGRVRPPVCRRPIHVRQRKHWNDGVGESGWMGVLDQPVTRPTETGKVDALEQRGCRSTMPRNLPMVADESTGTAGYPP